MLATLPAPTGVDRGAVAAEGTPSAPGLRHGGSLATLQDTSSPSPAAGPPPPAPSP